MMLRISERERWKLSRSLHDRNMQDQLDIARQLDSWGSNASDLKTKALMVKFREQILDSVYVLRQVINDLHPEFIYRTGLRKALMELFDKVNLRADFTLRATIDEQMDGFQREWEMAVYRVVQELLNNAQKHSRAHLVTLSLSKANDAFTLDYSDDGVGLDVSKIGKSFGTMGFPGMIGRVEGLGGRIQFRSEQGDGLKITIQWARTVDDAK
jgi:two-component system sensor histidine kinase ComP